MSDLKREYAPAVQNGQLVFTSPSAIQKYQACPRMWFRRYVLREKDKPPGKGAQVGLEGHARIEQFLKTGMNVLSKREMDAYSKGYIPEPGEDLMVEQPLTGLKVNGVTIEGKI